MTTSLEAMKAARGRLQDLRESEFYWGKFLAVTRCGIHEALTLLDAAIQREEAAPPSGVVSWEAVEEALREYDYESTVRSHDRRHQANQGFRLARALRAALSAPSEPMVPRARVIPVCHGCDVAGMSDHVHLEDVVFLDGEASDGE